jgi:hypothetical protein
MLALLFKIIEHSEKEIHFGDIMGLLTNETTATTIAEALVQLGFSIKRNHLLIDDNEVFEYESVISPSDLPIELMLRSILQVTGKEVLDLLNDY